ncbi:MAG TPA: hypothetical protein VIG76_02755 [Amnibacterium sp.]|uniref:hypothetical protein n=1 Tax=Amnibacterium sp. TaxID=1872496 RepID=UPI002F9221E8
MTAEAALPGAGDLTGTARRTARRVGIGALTAGVLLLGGVALHSTVTSDVDTTMTVAELDATIGITPAGSLQLDRAPASVQRSALDRETGDWRALQASGLPAGSAQRIGVMFTTTDRAAADRLAGVLDRATDFTVVVSAPSEGPAWNVGAVTAQVPLTVTVAHQLTERMTEAAWAASSATFAGWHVVTR